MALTGGRHRGGGRVRRDGTACLRAAVVLVWMVATYRIASWELPSAVAMATAITAGTAWAAGYYTGRRT